MSNDPHLDAIITDVIRDMVAAQRLFTAHDVTRAARAQHPHDAIAHAPVRDIVHRAHRGGTMGSYQSLSMPVYDRAGRVQAQAVVFYPAHADPDTYRTDVVVCAAPAPTHAPSSAPSTVRIRPTCLRSQRASAQGVITGVVPPGGRITIPSWFLIDQGAMPVPGMRITVACDGHAITTIVTPRNDVRMRATAHHMADGEQFTISMQTPSVGADRTIVIQRQGSAHVSVIAPV
jgi:hypothetical protein